MLLQVEPMEGRVVPAFPSFLTLNALGPLGATTSGFEDSVLAGRSVSGAGDVNGDGFADILVGAPAGGLFGSGAAYVVFGGADPGGSTVTLNALGTGGFTLRASRTGRGPAGA